MLFMLPLMKWKLKQTLLLLLHVALELALSKQRIQVATVLNMRVHHFTLTFHCSLDSLMRFAHRRNHRIYLRSNI